MNLAGDFVLLSNNDRLMYVVVYIRVSGECHFWDSARALFRFRCGLFFFSVRNFWVHHSTVRNKKNHSGAPFSVVFSHLSLTRKRKKNWMRTSSGEKIPQTRSKKFRTTCGPARAESQKGNPQTLYLAL